MVSTYRTNWSFGRSFEQSKEYLRLLPEIMKYTIKVNCLKMMQQQQQQQQPKYIVT